MAQIVRNSSVTIAATTTRACMAVMVGYRRTQLIITNTSAAAVATIAKGEQPAVAGYLTGLRINCHPLQTVHSRIPRLL